MYGRILVPIDGSAPSTAGLREAIKLAANHGSRLRLIHVIENVLALTPPPYGALFPQIMEQVRDAGRDLLANAESMAKGAGLAVDTRIVEISATAGEQIIQAAKDWPADLIVCGTHGRRGLRRIVMGSDAEFIVRRSPVPVLLVRAGEPAA